MDHERGERAGGGDESVMSSLDVRAPARNIATSLPFVFLSCPRPLALEMLTLGVAEVGAQETSVRDGVAALPDGF